MFCSVTMRIDINKVRNQPVFDVCGSSKCSQLSILLVSLIFFPLFALGSPCISFESTFVFQIY